MSSEANSDGEKSEKSQSGEPNNSSEDRDSSKGTPGTPTPKTIYHGPSRKGRTYNKHTVGTPIIHKCDLSHLPEGVTYHIKKNPKKVLHTITKVEEHWFEEVVLTYPDGHKETERAIRPQTIQRKGSLFFGSVQGALRSAMYNTFIQTCKQVGVSFRQYFKALLKAVKSGRTDYENLLPMTICLD